MLPEESLVTKNLHSLYNNCKRALKNVNKSNQMCMLFEHMSVRKRFLQVSCFMFQIKKSSNILLWSHFWAVRILLIYYHVSNIECRFSVRKCGFFRSETWKASHWYSEFLCINLVVEIYICIACLYHSLMIVIVFS